MDAPITPEASQKGRGLQPASPSKHSRALPSIKALPNLRDVLAAANSAAFPFATNATAPQYDTLAYSNR